jgi:hypothetical protein
MIQTIKNPIIKNAVAQEIRLYEEFPTAYNMFISGVLRSTWHINEYEVDEAFICNYSAYLIDCKIRKQQPDYEESFEKFKERTKTNGSNSNNQCRRIRATSTGAEVNGNNKIHCEDKRAQSRKINKATSGSGRKRGRPRKNHG